MLVYNQVIDLNNDRFDNINLIQIGDTVLFPARSGQGVEYWVADAPQQGTHDCVWILTKRYLERDLQTSPTEPVPSTKSNPKNWFMEIAGASIGVLWIMLIMCLIALCFIVWLIIHIIKNRRNPDAYPAVLGNIKSLSDQQVAAAIEKKLDEGEKIIKVERGVLVRKFGPKRIKVDMEFGDSKNRWIYLKPGEQVAKVTIKDRDGNTHKEFWREHCGNYFAVIKRGRFELPQGWDFQVNSTTSVTEESAKTDTPKATATTTNKPTPASVNLTDGQQITGGTFFINEEDEGTRIAFLIRKNQNPEL